MNHYKRQYNAEKTSHFRTLAYSWRQLATFTTAAHHWAPNRSKCFSRMGGLCVCLCACEFVCDWGVLPVCVSAQAHNARACARMHKPLAYTPACVVYRFHILYCAANIHGDRFIRTTVSKLINKIYHLDQL